MNITSFVTNFISGKHKIHNCKITNLIPSRDNMTIMVEDEEGKNALVTISKQELEEILNKLKNQ